MAREVFMPLTATEQALSRINVSNRQGGRGPGRARLQQELGCPAPPRPCSHPPTERAGELPPFTSNAPPGYLPAGYRSPDSEVTTSSPSLGGLTNDIDTDLDDIDLSGATEFAGPSDTWMASLPDLATVATVGLATTVQPPPTPYPAVLIDQRPSSILPPDPSARCTTARPMTASAQQPAKSFTSTATQVEPSTADEATAACPLNFVTDRGTLSNREHCFLCEMDITRITKIPTTIDVIFFTMTVICQCIFFLM